MMGDPWLSLVGMGDDTADALPPASRAAIDAAEVIFGGPRHLDLVQAGDRGQTWPVPFSVAPVLAMRGRPVVVLASGDPFWFGAGGSLVREIGRDEWQSFPAPSTFALVANRLGWRMEEITCHASHAAPFSRLRRILAPSARLICLVRDGDTPAALAEWLSGNGCGKAVLHACERMGGPHERIRSTTAAKFDLTGIAAPVAVAVELPAGAGLARVSGLPDDLFIHDGQITKRPVRALTLSTLAASPGELLWDIGAGSGSIGIEWCLAGGRAIAFERNAARAANVTRNIADFGVDHRMSVVEGDAVEKLADQPLPQAVFIGGGGNAELFSQLLDLLTSGTRIVANGVTLETEALLTRLHGTHGGDLMRIELAQATSLGGMRGWQPARPIVQWSVTL